MVGDLYHFLLRELKCNSQLYHNYVYGKLFIRLLHVERYSLYASLKEILYAHACFFSTCTKKQYRSVIVLVMYPVTGLLLYESERGKW